MNADRRTFLGLGAGAVLGSTLPGTTDTAPADSSRSDGPLKITSVKTYHLRHRLPKAIGPSTTLYPFREALLVKISTDSGLVGWGETAAIPGIQGIVEQRLAPALIGKNALEHRKLWRRMWGPNFGDGLATGAVDIALHDLRGKALQLSVAELYGGRLRDRVPAYASSMNYTEGVRPEDQFPEEAAGLVERGFRALKMRTGRFGPRRDLRVAAMVRDAIGSGVKLMADGNGAYTLSTAIAVAKELKTLGLEFFEEPLPQAPNYAAYEELTDKCEIAIAAGEVLDSRGTAQQLIVRRAMDIIQPDASLCGGIGECLFVAEMARLWGIQCVPHCWGGAITIAATLQVLSLLPDATWGHTTMTPMLELDVYENPFRDKIVTRPTKLRDGQVDVPTAPGLGVEVNEEVVQKYAVG